MKTFKKIGRSLIGASGLTIVIVSIYYGLLYLSYLSMGYLLVAIIFIALLLLLLSINFDERLKL